MFTAWSNGIVDRYWIKRVTNGKFEEGQSHGRLRDVNFTFLDRGFFDILLYPIFPLFVIGSLLYPYCAYLLFAEALPSTIAFSGLLMTHVGLGITCGSHRLWCHRSYKAKLPLRCFLALGFIFGGQFSLYTWARAHRLHHKFSDTDADPHNIHRGLWFSQNMQRVNIMRKEHPLCDIKVKEVDCSDLERDPVVTFTYDHFWPFYICLTVIFPVAFPMFAFGESFKISVLALVFRSMLSHTDAGFINSATHQFGDRPFNKAIKASQIWFVSIFAFGEGYHNFHHQWPSDYAISEDGSYFNFGKVFIDAMAWLGQAYDLKRASPSLVEKAKARTAFARQVEVDRFKEIVKPNRK